MEEEQQSCGPVCRFVYLVLDQQWELAKAEFDRLLMSDDLRSFVHYLSKDRVVSSADPGVLLGDALQGVLESGFVGKDVELMRKVIANPGCIQPLVDRIYIDGGLYWFDLMPDPTAEDQALLERVRVAVMTKISQSDPTAE